MTETIEVDPLEALLDRARGELDVANHEDGLSRVQAFASWRREQARPLRKMRWIAWAFSVLWVLDFAYLTWFLRLLEAPGAWRLALALLLPPGVFWTATRWARRSDFTAHILARVLLLAACMAGASATVFQDHTFTSQLGMALGQSVPILVVPAALLMAAVLGAHGLRTATHRTPRTGFEMLLSLSLVMGLADAVFMLFVGITKAGVVPMGPWPFILPLVLGVAGYGLLRGRVWGLLLMAVGNLAEVALILDDSLFGSSLLTGAAAFVLVLTASVQLLLPAPVYAAMMMPTRRWVERLQAADGSLARILAALIATLLGLSALMSTVLAPLFASMASAIS